jgi:hypothetical protein
MRDVTLGPCRVMSVLSDTASCLRLTLDVAPCSDDAWARNRFSTSHFAQDAA